MQRIRRSVKRKLLFSTMFVVIGILMLGTGMMITKIRLDRSYGRILSEREEQLQGLVRRAFVVTTDMRRGEEFTAENVSLSLIYTDTAQSLLASEVVGQVSCADLPAGTIVLPSLCTKRCEETERVCVFQDIRNGNAFTAGTAVDIRIRFPNGENYLVIPKKYLEKEDARSETCSFLLDEAEQLRMSSAQYDSENYKGAVIYLVAFSEERVQEDAQPLYIPSVQVTEQLIKNGSIPEASRRAEQEKREALEERLRLDIERRREGI